METRRFSRASSASSLSAETERGIMASRILGLSAAADDLAGNHEDFIQAAVHVPSARRLTLSFAFFSGETRAGDEETRKFAALRGEWLRDTAHMSSVADKAMHPSYQRIIGMGTTAVSLILADLQRRPAHWFWALKSITGEDPVPANHRGRVREMTWHWIRWGKSRGYV